MCIRDSHKVSYDERGITVNQTIIYIPEQGLAIAFLHDVTKQEQETCLLYTSFVYVGATVGGYL